MRLPAALGFGVPFLFAGASSDFLGLPLPFFTGDGDESPAPFKGTVVVVVRSVSSFVGGGFFEGVPLSMSSRSASTVTRIRQGLSWFSVCAVDLLGEEEVYRIPGGVVRKKSWSRTLPLESLRTFRGVVILRLALDGDIVRGLCWDMPNGSGEEVMIISLRDMLPIVDAFQEMYSWIPGLLYKPPFSRC